MNKLVAAALEENPIAFKREFETAMTSLVDKLQAQHRIEIAQSITVDGEEPNTSEE